MRGRMQGKIKTAMQVLHDSKNAIGVIPDGTSIRFPFSSYQTAF